MSHTAARQTDVATDGCATPYSHHTRTRALPPHYEPHTGTPGAATASGVWANPILGEADMTADNEENRATKADPEKRCLCWWEKPQVLLRLPWLNPGTGETVLVFPGPRSLQPRAQPSQPHWQPHEACGGKNVGWGPRKSGSPGSARTSWATSDPSLTFQLSGLCAKGSSKVL